MPTMTAPAAELDPRRKKLRFRSWHRGMREMDLILGRFADAELGALNDTEIDQYEELLEFPDDQFFLLITGERPVPAHLDCPLLRRILAFGRAYQA
ncbi:succinate dehydrogenase assembly factor 2 [Mesorhizobium sp. SP-1A]|uniref:FAD assembly factor SdhE n=1 Tax=Mesorhizobium sp. SP-1A TaxID=3077840 RepID=UPI0039657F0B